MSKKLLSLLLVFVMSISLCSITAFADSDGIKYLNADEAAVAIREQMKERKTEVTVYYQTSGNIFTEYVDIFMKVFTHTGDPREGDYLFYQSLVSELPIPQISDYTILGGGKFGMKVTFNLAYRTTAEQEAQVDIAVAELLDSLELDGKSDYDKVKAIYDWMSANIEYDFEGLAMYLIKHIASTAYAALFDHSAVCQGYSVLFYRLCLEEGIDARVIQDVTGGGAPHVWNIVQMDNGRYYYIDTTLGAGFDQKFDLSSDGFFLKGSDYWSKLPLYTLGDQYTNGALYPGFAEKYPISADNYDGSTEHTHSMKHVAAKSPTMFAKGNIEYWQCSDCGKCFSDPDGFNQISSADTVLNKTGFSFSFITDFFARLMNSLRSFLPC